MYKTIFNLAQPHVQNLLLKQAAEYGAAYLRQRREQRLSDEPEDLNATLVVSKEERPPVQKSFSPVDAFWFLMSGVLVGSALGVIVSSLLRPPE